MLHKTCWVDSTLGSLTGQYNGLHLQYVHGSCWVDSTLGSLTGLCDGLHLQYVHGSCNFKTKSVLDIRFFVADHYSANLAFIHILKYSICNSNEKLFSHE